MAGTVYPALERLHQLVLVVGEQRVEIAGFQIGKHSPKALVSRLRVRHHQVFVIAVKGDQRSGAQAIGMQLLQTLVNKHPVDEVLAQHRIVKPPLFFDRQIRHLLRDHLGKGAHGIALGMTLVVVAFDPEHAAAGRLALEHVAADIDELGQHVKGIVLQLLGDIDRRIFHAQHARLAIALDQADRRAGYSQANGNLRAVSAVVDKLAELFQQPVVALVRAVKAHFLAVQTTTQGNQRAGIFSHGLSGRHSRIPA